jgi:GTP diphosphokinase / guanosine-3',5'-bis(diphosphate) 3'-diphosphatase
MLIAMSKDIRILLIKLADRLHNMRTLEHMGEDARRRIAQETLDIYAPLAHRLGIDWMRRELVDLAFHTLKPQAARELEEQIQLGREERSRYVEEVSGVLSAKLGEAGLRAEVTGREKELASIHAKMEAQHVGVDQIHDVTAFRVILDEPEAAVYQALGVVHAIWRPVPGRFKDYVALPKPNGYQSLHTAVIGPAASAWRCRSAPARCTGTRSSGSPPTGATRRAPAPTRAATTTRSSPGCASSWSASRSSRTPTSSSTR